MVHYWQHHHYHRTRRSDSLEHDLHHFNLQHVQKCLLPDFLSLSLSLSLKLFLIFELDHHKRSRHDTDKSHCTRHQHNTRHFGHGALCTQSTYHMRSSLDRNNFLPGDTEQLQRPHMCPDSLTNNPHCVRYLQRHLHLHLQMDSNLR